MKRSVAIYGRTPMFLRWAIQYACPLRELYPQNLPDSTFRQLRGIRELGFARQASRVRDGVCLHPAANLDSPEEALGFPIDDVLTTFGDAEFIQGQCSNCPANALLPLGNDLWAGCFGILAADARFNLNDMLRGNLRQTEAEQPEIVDGERSGKGFFNRYDVPRLFEQIVKKHDMLGEASQWNWQSQSLWVSMWRDQERTITQWDFIARILRLALEEVQNGGSSAANQSDDRYTDGFVMDLSQLLAAVRQCRMSNLAMHTELVPSGFSDGTRWTIDPHCQICKTRWFDPTQPCHTCQSRGGYQNEIKLRVLGIRPYLRIAEIVGLERAKKLIR